jgi:DNA-binding transcriptional LysR family regulator
MQPEASYRWDDVRIFLALHREGTLALAAHRLGIDTSTASRRLVALEEALGARLFDRTRDGLQPTSAAEQLLVHAEEAERGMLSITLAASGLDVRPEGTVRITAPPGITELFLAPLLVELHRSHPRLVLELDASQQVLDLSRNEADIALRTVRPQGADLIMTKLATSTYVPLASPEYAREVSRTKNGTLRWIAWGDAYARFPPAQWIASHVDARGIVLKASSLAAQAAAAASGLGIALLPESLTSQFSLAPVTLPKPFASAAANLPVDEVWLVGHRALRDVPRVAVVWDFIRAQAAEKFGNAKPVERARPSGRGRNR